MNSPDLPIINKTIGELIGGINARCTKPVVPDYTYDPLIMVCAFKQLLKAVQYYAGTKDSDVAERALKQVDDMTRDTIDA